MKKDKIEKRVGLGPVSLALISNEWETQGQPYRTVTFGAATRTGGISFGFHFAVPTWVPPVRGKVTR